MGFGQNSMICIACEAVRRIFTKEKQWFFAKNVDNESHGHVVKKQLRCGISSCFDMGNICCKECNIKDCRYKCDFIYKEVCEHEYIE